MSYNNVNSILKSCNKQKQHKVQTHAYSLEHAGMQLCKLQKRGNRTAQKTLYSVLQFSMALG